MSTQLDFLTAPSIFWTRWLRVVVLCVAAFGLLLVLAPQLTRQGFSLLLYADTQSIGAFGAEATRYIELVHAVLGAVIFGWAIALWLVTNRFFARGERIGWQIVAISVMAWLVPDTAYSLWSGFWQNAALNAAFGVLFAAPLVATFRTFHVARN